MGIGRLISEIAPLVDEFIGIDNAKLMINEAQKIAKYFNNTSIEEMNLENLSDFFPKKYFNYSLCMLNTLGNVKDEVVALSEINKVTQQQIFITTYLKGTIENRKNWYKSVGIEIEKIDSKNEIFYSKSGLQSKSFSLEDIQKIAKLAGLKVQDSKILHNVMLWVELTSL